MALKHKGPSELSKSLNSSSELSKSLNSSSKLSRPPQRPRTSNPSVDYLSSASSQHSNPSISDYSQESGNSRRDIYGSTNSQSNSQFDNSRRDIYGSTNSQSNSQFDNSRRDIYGSTNSQSNSQFDNSRRSTYESTNSQSNSQFDNSSNSGQISSLRGGLKLDQQQESSDHIPPKKKCDTIKLTIIYCFSSVKNIDTYTFKNETALSNSKKIESYVDVILNY